MAQHDSFPAIKREVLQFLRSQSVDGRIRAMILDLVNQGLRVQSTQLSNQEKDSLTHEVMKDILLDMLKEYQDISGLN
jgi:ABC-type microcin C transport system duplicated ATPase subunit YejF